MLWAGGPPEQSRRPDDRALSVIADQRLCGLRDFVVPDAPLESAVNGEEPCVESLLSEPEGKLKALRYH